MIGRRMGQKKGEEMQGSSSWDVELEHNIVIADRSVNESYTSEIVRFHLSLFTHSLEIHGVRGDDHITS